MIIISKNVWSFPESPPNFGLSNVFESESWIEHFEINFELWFKLKNILYLLKYRWRLDELVHDLLIGLMTKAFEISKNGFNENAYSITEITPPNHLYFEINCQKWWVKFFWDKGLVRSYWEQVALQELGETQVPDKMCRVTS